MPTASIPGHPTALPLPRKEGRATCQLDDFDEDPVVGGGGHQLEEQRGQGKVVLGVAPGQLADDVDRCRLDPYDVRGVPINQELPRQTGRSMSVPPLVPSVCPSPLGTAQAPTAQSPDHQRAKKRAQGNRCCPSPTAAGPSPARSKRHEGQATHYVKGPRCLPPGQPHPCAPPAMPAALAAAHADLSALCNSP